MTGRQALRFTGSWPNVMVDPVSRNRWPSICHVLDWRKSFG